MKYIKTFENKEKYYILMVNKDDIDNLKLIIDQLKKDKINFKVLDSGSRNNKKYFIISKELKNYHFTEFNLESFGDEIDYNLIISANKYNL